MLGTSLDTQLHREVWGWRRSLGSHQDAWLRRDVMSWRGVIGVRLRCPAPWGHGVWAPSLATARQPHMRISQG